MSRRRPRTVPTLLIERLHVNQYIRLTDGPHISNLADYIADESALVVQPARGADEDTNDEVGLHHVSVRTGHGGRPGGSVGDHRQQAGTMARPRV
jgi:hypothetical protein